MACTDGGGDGPAEPYLLTPGPLTTSARTKRAMLRDWGSRDGDFIALVADIRRRLVAMAGGGDDTDCVLMQGSGTFAVEAALASFVPRDGRVLVPINGAYGRRIATILDYLGRGRVVLDTGDWLPPRPDQVDAVLARDPAVTHVALVHCETTSGVVNPLAGIAEVVRRRGRRLIVDSMSAFGALPLNVRQAPIEALVSSANKCIEGVPGFAFVIAGKAALAACEGNSHSLSLDLFDQWTAMTRNGQWRFTPPTHVLAAFHEALLQHAEEGGAVGRQARYARNRDVLVAGMRAMGFETLLPDTCQGPIIVTFLCPADPAFRMDRFYDEIKARGYVIYPGKLTAAETFRIGCIGRLDETVMHGVLDAVREAIAVMGVTSCRPVTAQPSKGERR